MTRIISIVGGLQPSTPTIGTATDGGTGTSANVAFTASTYIGKGTITYTATSSPGGLTGTSATSPISVTGLTTGTAYTFTVTGTTNYGVTSLTSGSSNSVTPANPDSGSYYPLSTVTVGATSVASITFTSIPSTYTHLQLRFIHTVTNGSTPTFMTFNSDTGANYSRHSLRADGSTLSSGGNANQSDMDIFGYLLGSSTTDPTAGIVDILDYANTNKYKTVRTLAGCDQNTSGGEINFNSNNWRSTSAITSISIATDFPFKQYSSFALYGIKGA